jgi:hypothetical protein
VQKRHGVWIFKGWLAGRLSGPSGATSGRWREMVAEKVSDVGVGAQGHTSADAEPSEKGNPTPSTSRGGGSVRRGSRFDSESVIPLLSPVSQIRTSSIVWMGEAEPRETTGAWAISVFGISRSGAQPSSLFADCTAQAGCAVGEGNSFCASDTIHCLSLALLRGGGRRTCTAPCLALPYWRCGGGVASDEIFIGQMPPLSVSGMRFLAS